MAYQKTFETKAGKEILNQMFTFADKGNRDICLIPEVTGIIQELWNENYFNAYKKPIKIFYISRCYRYEKPQKGRYREFTQLGVEILGGKSPSDKDECINSLIKCITLFLSDNKFTLKDNIKRGLNYYVEDGFEIECSNLGAQKQIAGGGRYKEGIGWAIGIDRLLIAKATQ